MVTEIDISELHEKIFEEKTAYEATMLKNY